MNKLVFNYILDLKKKQIDKFERAAIIRKFIDDNNLSIRKMAELINEPRSTIEDWLLWERMEEDKYKELKTNGYSHIEIYKSLRNNKKKEVLPIERISKYEKSIDDVLCWLKQKEKIIEYGGDVYIKILALKDQINRVLMYSEKNK